MFSKDWTNQDFADIENEFRKIKQYLVMNNISDIEFDELSNEFKPKGYVQAARITIISMLVVIFIRVPLL